MITIPANTPFPLSTPIFALQKADTVAGDVTYVKGTTTDFASGRASFKFGSTSSSDLISVSGNLASLVDGVGNSIFLSNSTHYTFNNLFYPGTNTTCLDIFRCLPSFRRLSGRPYMRRS